MRVPRFRIGTIMMAVGAAAVVVGGIAYQARRERGAEVDLLTATLLPVAGGLLGCGVIESIIEQYSASSKRGPPDSPLANSEAKQPARRSGKSRNVQST